MSEYFDVNDILEPLKYPCKICGKTFHWNDFLEDRTHRAMMETKTMFVAWVGQTRMGKSWSEIIHGCKIFDDEHFGIDNIIFPSNDRLTELRKWYKDHTFSLCILEEISTGDVADWWTKASKTLRYIIDTQGARSNILWINSPRLSRFPTSVRDAVMYRVRCERYGKSHVVNHIDRRFILPDNKSDRELIRWANVVNINPVKVPDSSRVRTIIKDYAIIRREWMDKMLDNDFFLDERDKEKPIFLRPQLPMEIV